MLCYSTTTKLCYSTTRQTMSLVHHCWVSAQPLFSASFASIAMCLSQLMKATRGDCNIWKWRDSIRDSTWIFFSVYKLQNLSHASSLFIFNKHFGRKLTCHIRNMGAVGVWKSVTMIIGDFWLRDWSGWFQHDGSIWWSCTGTIWCRWHDGSNCLSCTSAMVVMVVQWWYNGTMVVMVVAMARGKQRLIRN